MREQREYSNARERMRVRPVPVQQLLDAYIRQRILKQGRIMPNDRDMLASLDWWEQVLQLFREKSWDWRNRRDENYDQYLAEPALAEHFLRLGGLPLATEHMEGKQPLRECVKEYIEKYKQ